MAMLKQLNTRLIMILFGIMAGFLQSADAQSIRVKATHYGDNFVNKGDSVELILLDGRGSFQWQKSIDGVRWEDVDGATSSGISCKIDTTLYFRVRMKEENCDPAFSQLMSVIPVSINENAVVLKSEDLQIHSDSTELSQGIYRLSTTQNIDPKPGEVIVGQQDEGFLRKVQSAVKVGNEWVITTTQATIEEVIDEISMKDSLAIGINWFNPKMATVNGMDVPVKITNIAPGLTVKTGIEGIALGPLVLIDENAGDGHIYAALTAGNIAFNPVVRRELEVTEANGLERLAFYSDGEIRITTGMEIETTTPHQKKY
jgi:hypothetical protein